MEPGRGRVKGDSRPPTRRFVVAIHVARLGLTVSTRPRGPFGVGSAAAGALSGPSRRNERRQRNFHRCAPRHPPNGPNRDRRLQIWASEFRPATMRASGPGRSPPATERGGPSLAQTMAQRRLEKAEARGSQTRGSATERRSGGGGGGARPPRPSTGREDRAARWSTAGPEDSRDSMRSGSGGAGLIHTSRHHQMSPNASDE